MDKYASCSFLIARKCCPKRKLLHLKHQILPISDRRKSTKSASFYRGASEKCSKVFSWCISDSIIKTRLKTARKIGGLPSCQKTFTDILRGYVLCACVWHFRCQVKNADGNLSIPSSGTASRTRIKGSTSIWEGQQTEHLAHNYNPLKGNKRVTAQPFALLYCSQ